MISISLFGILVKIIGAIVIAFLGVTIGLFYKGIDRKLAARMQARVGPPIRQPFMDFYKLIIYLLTLPAIGMVVGGFASGSPYANVGAQREMVLMMSYELPLVTTVIAIGWKLSQVYPQLNVFSLAVINAYPIWELVGPLGFMGVILLFITFAAVTPGELSKVPFDAPE